MNDIELTPIAWEDICNMDIQGNAPDLFLVEAWHLKEDRLLTEGELDFANAEYSSAIYETMFHRC
jgi:hypothetical protein